MDGQVVTTALQRSCHGYGTDAPGHLQRHIQASRETGTFRLEVQALPTTAVAARVASELQSRHPLTPAAQPGR